MQETSKFLDFIVAKEVRASENGGGKNIGDDLMPLTVKRVTMYYEAFVAHQLCTANRITIDLFGPAAYEQYMLTRKLL